MVMPLIKISFFIVNTSHVVMKNDLKPGHFGCNSLSLLQPSFSLIDVTIFGVPHPDRIDNLKELFLPERDHRTQLLLFLFERLILDD